MNKPRMVSSVVVARVLLLDACCCAYGLLIVKWCTDWKRATLFSLYHPQPGAHSLYWLKRAVFERVIFVLFRHLLICLETSSEKQFEVPHSFVNRTLSSTFAGGAGIDVDRDTFHGRRGGTHPPRSRDPPTQVLEIRK